MIAAAEGYPDGIDIHDLSDPVVFANVAADGIVP